jgi:hypothetical protein
MPFAQECGPAGIFEKQGPKAVQWRTMKREIMLLAAVCLSGPAMMAQTPATSGVPVAEEPHHHKVLENDYVRVYKLELAPQEATLMHQHGIDYFALMLSDTILTNERVGAKPARVNWKGGEIRFSKGGFSHIVRNEAASPLRNITIELLRPGDSDEIGTAEAAAKPGAVQFSVAGVVRKGAATFDNTVPPGAAMQKQAYNGPRLMLAVTDLDLRDEVEGRPPTEIHQQSGDVVWVPGGSGHTISNIGKQPARWVSVEFKN